MCYPIYTSGWVNGFLISKKHGLQRWWTLGLDPLDPILGPCRPWAQQPMIGLISRILCKSIFTIFDLLFSAVCPNCSYHFVQSVGQQTNHIVSSNVFFFSHTGRELDAFCRQHAAASSHWNPKKVHQQHLTLVYQRPWMVPWIASFLWLKRLLKLPWHGSINMGASAARLPRGPVEASEGH